MSDNEDPGGSGCGCVPILILVLVVWALLFGLPINNKVLNINIFPPRITYR